MKRFVSQRSKSSSRNIWLSAFVFLLIIGVFYYGVTSLSGKTDAEQKASLERALQESTVQCYCVEGSYPENLEYLKTNYGISYDKSQFFVDYQTLGENIMPDITVITKEK